MPMTTYHVGPVIANPQGSSVSAISSSGATAPSPIMNSATLTANEIIDVEESDDISRHAEYHIEDGNIILLVEKTLFKVHRHFLVTQSPVFKDMLGMPVSTEDEDVAVEGLSDDNPITLPGDKADDFASLLWMFYNPSVTTYDASITRWKGVLTLADKYQMDQLLRSSVRALGNIPNALSPIEKIALREKHNIEKEWALDAYYDICKRRTPPTAAEGCEIGARVWALINEAREEVSVLRNAHAGCPAHGSRFARRAGHYTPYPKVSPTSLAHPPYPVFPSSLIAQSNHLLANSSWSSLLSHRSQATGVQEELGNDLAGMPWPGAPHTVYQRDLTPHQKEVVRRIMLR
ncbi:hypothetical protein HGRIS_007099 [Hohenbuehelia grisea]|uniref:BTB domain-containing protein n=1 Tax=Hohenbuehelia grisea TaxID=104357 RepID=A0ABR3JB18_9AGAR